MFRIVDDVAHRGRALFRFVYRKPRGPSLRSRANERANEKYINAREYANVCERDNPYRRIKHRQCLKCPTKIYHPFPSVPLSLPPLSLSFSLSLSLSLSLSRSHSLFVFLSLYLIFYYPSDLPGYTISAYAYLRSLSPCSHDTVA